MQPAYYMVLWAHTVYPNAQLRSTVRVRVAVEELVDEADDKLFTGVMYNKQHVVVCGMICKILFKINKNALASGGLRPPD